MNEQELSGHREAVRKGVSAKAELEITRQALRVLRTNAVESIIATDPNNIAVYQRLIATAQVVDHLEEYLRDVIDNGVGASKALARFEQGTR